MQIILFTCSQKEFEDTKGVIRGRNALQNITQKTKDRGTRTPTENLE